MNTTASNTWEQMFGQDFDTWNTCHRMLPNLTLSQRLGTTKQVKFFTTVTDQDWNQIKGPDWPETKEEFLFNDSILPVAVEKEINGRFNKTELSVTDDEFSFLKNNINLYNTINFQLQKLVNDGFLVTGIPLKLQSLKEKNLIIKNFNECLEWYNEWVTTNKFGNCYTHNELDTIMSVENHRLNLPIDQQNLLQ